MSGNRGSKYHPSRVSGQIKFARVLEAKKQEKKKKDSFKPLDTSKPDWSK